MTEKQLKEKNFVSAVIYVHNSAAELKKFIPQVESFFSDHFLKHELIFVNDASEDESINIIREVSNNYGGGSCNCIKYELLSRAGKEYDRRSGFSHWRLYF